MREMTHTKRKLSYEKTIELLKSGEHGILALNGDDGYPYAVPLSYVYFNDKIYFHSAKAGHKIDAIIENPKVSFAVIDEDTIVSAEYTTYFRSVIAFGQARIVEGDEWQSAFTALVEKYSGDQPQANKQKEIGECSQAYLIAIDIEHITGKEAIEYVRRK